METKTRSQLFPDKEYNTTIDELEERDYNIKSELYKVRIFNKNIHIASGNIIKDEKYTTLYYCYVYVILKDRVKAKLGVYEKVIEGTEIPIQYDLSLFDEGSMLVFDDYYKDTKKINEFEVAEINSEGIISIYDYLQGKMITNLKTLQKDMKRHSSRLVKIFDMIRKNKDTEIEYIRMFDKFTKYFNDLVIFNEELVDLLKLPSTTQLELLFILCILEFYFSIKFVFVYEKDENLILFDDIKYNELRTVFNNAKYSDIIVLNIDSKNIVKTVANDEKSNGSEELDKLLKEYTIVSEGIEEEVEKPVEPPEELLEDLEDLDVPVETLDETDSKTKNRTLLAISNPSINTQINTNNAKLTNEPQQSKKLTFTGSILKPKKNEDAPLSVIPEETASASASATLSAMNTPAPTKKQSKSKGPPPIDATVEEQKSSTKSAAKSKKSKGPPPSADIEEEQKSSTKSSTKSSSKTKKEAAAVEPPTIDEKTKEYQATVEKMLSTIDIPKLSKSKKSS